MAADRRVRIVVAGAGSVGCYVGGCLALAGRDVTLLLATGAGGGHCAAWLARLRSRRGGPGAGRRRRCGSQPIRRRRSPRPISSCVTVKSGATEAMAGLIAEHAVSGVTVVSLQNGVGNVDVLLARLGGMARVVPGMVPFNVVQTRVQGQPPRFHRATSGTVQTGAGVAGLREALAVKGVAVTESGDMAGVLWGKLLLNLNNALNALAGIPLAAELADKRWRRLLARQIEEGLKVLKAAGVRPARIEGVPPGAVPRILRLPDWLFRRVAASMLAIDPEARSSMWEDLEARRSTEVDHLQGAILALAAKTAVRAPLTERIVRLVKEAEAARAGSPGLTPERIG